MQRQNTTYPETPYFQQFDSKAKIIKRLLEERGEVIPDDAIYLDSEWCGVAGGHQVQNICEWTLFDSAAEKEGDAWLELKYDLKKHERSVPPSVYFGFAKQIAAFAPSTFPLCAWYHMHPLTMLQLQKVEPLSCTETVNAI